MDTETLSLFAEIMRHRSFTHVAKQRGIAASSVSRSISALEAEIGARLFQRTTRQIMPTEAGLLYFERINSVLEELELARQLATDTSEKPQGTLRITAPKVFGEMHVVPLLAEFARRYPELSLEVLLNDRFTDLVEERIDVAIRVGTLEDSSFIARPLMPMSFYVTASPEYIDKHGAPEMPEQIAEHNCLLFPRSGYNFNWLFKRRGKTQEVSIRGKHLITQSSAIKQCALAGMGLALLPDWLIRTEVESERLVRLFKDFQVTATDFKGSVWLLYPSREYVPAKVKLFSDFLIANFNAVKN